MVNRLRKYYAQLSELGKAAVIVVMTLSIIILVSGEPVLFIPLIFIIFSVNLLRILWKKFSLIYLRNPRHSIDRHRANTSKTDNYINENEIQNNDAYDKDNWEGNFWEAEEVFTVLATLHFNYEDGSGKRTERTVEVRRVGTYGQSHLILGHCQLRNATRTFLTDRIIRCIDPATGELISDTYAYLRGKYESSPNFARDKLYENEYDTLRVLLYIGKADNQLRAAEKVIIRNTCRTLSNDDRMTDEMIDDLFLTLGVPTFPAFRLAVGRLAKKEQSTCKLILKAAEDMIATQKTAHPSEVEALEYIKKKFSILGA